jgi:uncharacterized phosphatase
MIYFVRHGESEANRRMRNGEKVEFAEKYYAPLTQTGREQAQETAEVLKDTNIDLVITSGLERAIDTGKIINQYHHAPTIVMDNLNERRDKRTADTDAEWHNSFEFERKAHPDIEALDDFKDRVVRTIEEIKEKYGDKNVLVVAHGGTSHIFRRYFSGEPWEGNIRKVMMKTAEVAEFNFEKEESK